MANGKDKLSSTFQKTYQPLWDKILDEGKYTDPIDTSLEKQAKPTPVAHAVISRYSELDKFVESSAEQSIDASGAYTFTLTDRSGWLDTKAEICLHSEADAATSGSPTTETLAPVVDTVALEIAALAPSLALGTLFAGKTADTSPLQLQLGGESSAVGTDTLATADIFSRVTDYGNISVCYGRATFSARAEVSGDDIAYASATSFAEVSGADFIFTGTQTRSSALESPDGATATERSQTYIMAIDFEDWDLRDGPIVIDRDTNDHFEGWVPYLQDLIDGNVATLDVDAVVEGTNTYVEVGSSLLTIEDQLSFVGAQATSGLG